MLQYEDFSIRIGSSANEIYPVAIGAPAGEGHSTFEMPFAGDALNQMLQGLSSSIGNSSLQTSRDVFFDGGLELLQTPQEIGKLLFNSLFKDDCLDLYKQSINLLRRKSKGLRIKLMINPEEKSLRDVSRLPWEFMYRDETNEFLSLSNQTPLVRYLEVSRSFSPIPMQGSLRILVVISDPKFVAALNLEQEKKRIKQSWGSRTNVHVDFLENPTKAKLQEQLAVLDYHVLHFMGHGDFDKKSGEGVLLLEKEDGSPEKISGTALGVLLRDEPKLRIVFLNACKTAQGSQEEDHDPFSGVAAAIVMAGIPTVVAMQFPISDEAAIDFASQFYKMLPDYHPVDFIVAEARKTLFSHQPNSMEWATPVLFMRTPDGIIFESVFKLNPVNADQLHVLSRLSGKVKKFWIEGKLQEDVPTKPPLVLTKEFVPDAVKQAWAGVVGQAELNDRFVPEWKSVSAVFDELDRSMLIIGDPGYGKSVTLLILSQELLRRHEQISSHPVPVVLFLSTWSRNFSSIEEWVVMEIAHRYKISATRCEEWLSSGRLSLMLDSLDEVNKEDQEACIQAINAFVEKQKEQEFPIGLAVCCREEDYHGLNTRFNFDGAIKILPLNADQIKEYIQKVGEGMTGLQTLLEQDSQLLKEAESPLMLSMMSMAYSLASQEMLHTNAESGESAALKRRYLLAETYVNTVFERKAKADETFSKEQTTQHLSWLARRMKEHHQSVFLIESLQPSWLSATWQRIVNLIIYSLFLGFPLAFILERMWHVSNLIDPAPSEIYPIVYHTRFFWCLIIPIWVVLAALWDGFLRSRVKTVNIGKAKKVVRLLGSILVYYLVWLGLWLLLWFILQPFENKHLSVWLRHPLVSGLILVILYGIRMANQNATSYVGASESLNWSWRRSLKGLAIGLASGLAIWLIYGLLRSYWGDENPWRNWDFYPPLGAMIGMVYGGLKMGLVKSKSKPNEGILLSLRNSLLGAAIVGPTIGLAVIPILKVNPSQFIAEKILLTSFWLGVTAFVVAFFWFGGVDVIRHYSLRLMIILTQKMPLRLSKFLDHAADLILLQKVGGGYIFRNRLLQDYFAKKPVHQKDPKGETHNH